MSSLGYILRILWSRVLILLAAFTLWLLVVAIPVDATTLYVSPTGTDTNAGTASKPLRTIKQGLSRIHSGDTLLLKPGTYPESVDLSVVGAPKAAITIKATQAKAAIINAADQTIGVGSLLPVSNIRLIGLKIRGAETGLRLDDVQHLLVNNCEVTGCYRGVTIKDGADLTFQGVMVRDNRFGFIFGVNGSTAIRGILLEDCVAQRNWYGNGNPKDNTDGFLVNNVCSEVILRRCTALQHDDAGFDIKAANTRLNRCLAAYNTQAGFKLWPDGIVMSNCLSHHNKGHGIVCAGNNLRFWNCTVACSGCYSLRVEASDPASVLVRNCIIVSSPVYVTNTLYDDDYNLYNVPAGQDMLVTGQRNYKIEDLHNGLAPLGARSRVGLPRFVNFAKSDYHPGPDSPALGAGIWDPCLVRDLSGAIRSATEAPDLGAYKAGCRAVTTLSALTVHASATATPAGLTELHILSNTVAVAEISIHNIAGRQVAILAQQNLQPGSNTLLWNGKSSQGTVAPRGMYVVQVSARTNAGETAHCLLSVQR